MLNLGVSKFSHATITQAPNANYVEKKGVNCDDAFCTKSNVFQDLDAAINAIHLKYKYGI